MLMRFCMFCGKEIPEQAVFCPSCGARQPELEKIEEPVKEPQEEENEEDNIALSLLSKVNFASKGNSGAQSTSFIEKKKPEKKAVKIEADGKPVTIPEPVNPVKKPVREEIVNDAKTASASKTDKSDNEYEGQNSKQATDSLAAKISTGRTLRKQEPVTDIKVSVEEDNFIDDEDAEMMAKMMSMLEEGKDTYVHPILEDIAEEIREEKIASNFEKITGTNYDEKASSYNENENSQNSFNVEKNAEEQVAENLEKKEEIKNTSDVEKSKTELLKEKLKEAKDADKKAQEQKPRRQRNSRPIYKKRNLSEEDESENEDSAPARMNINSTISAGNDGLTADEIADIEKYKEYKESAEGKADKAERLKTPSEGRTVKGEGRKKGGRNKEIRRNIDKEIAERDIRDIQHEETDIKDSTDSDYDGYYENVKPIDFDKMHDNTAVVKTALTGIVVVALVCILFYFIITFFIQ